MTNTQNLTCHPGSAATKAAASSVSKRRTLATVLSLAAAAGHGDGATYADCVACGSRAYVGRAATDGAGLNLGHDVADANGGRYCPCNLLPLCRRCNADMADDDMSSVLTPRYDSRQGWDGVFAPDAGARETTDNSPRGRAMWLPVS